PGPGSIARSFRRPLIVDRRVLRGPAVLQTSKKGSSGDAGALVASKLVPKRRLIVIVNAAIPGAIGPIPVGVPVVLWRALELIFGHANAVAAEPGVVFQIRPRHRVVVLAHAKESAKRHHCICDLAADFVDHDPLDAPDFAI